MKRLFITLLFALIGICTAQAQMWLGGSAKATVNKETKSFTVAPDVGYCIPNTPFSIACAVEYEGTFQQGEAYAHALTVSPYFRYDICEIGERFTLFVDLEGNFDALAFNSFDVGLTPGVSFDLTEHWSAEFSCGSLCYKWERVPDGNPKQKFVLDFATVAPSFGINYNF